MNLDNEINLKEILKFFWLDRFKILLITLATIILVAFYYKVLVKVPEQKYFTSTEIKQVPTFEVLRYNAYNSYIKNFFGSEAEETKNDISDGDDRDFKKYSSFIVLNSELFYNLFIDVINEEDVLLNILQNSNLFDKNQNSKEEIYNIVSSINIFKKRKSPVWLIEGITHDPLLWKNILRTFEKEVNEEVRKRILFALQQSVTFQEQQKKFKLDDLNYEISNALKSYDNEILNKIAFLQEQSEIARALGIVKNSQLERSETYMSEKGFITSIKTETPYYMRGYEMIDKEIELIKAREKRDLFIDELIDLEKEKEKILMDQKIERIKNIIFKTPIYESNSFLAAEISTEKTIYQKQNLYFKSSFLRMIIFATFFGLIISFTFSIIKNFLFKKR